MSNNYHWINNIDSNPIFSNKYIAASSKKGIKNSIWFHLSWFEKRFFSLRLCQWVVLSQYVPYVFCRLITPGISHIFILIQPTPQYKSSVFNTIGWN